MERSVFARPAFRNLVRPPFFVGALAAAFVALAANAGATGSAHITAPDGTTTNYADVHIAVDAARMTMTSHDRHGTLVIEKAACSRLGDLVRCFPYDAILEQQGATAHIPLADGTVWLNPTAKTLTLPDSTLRISPRGVIASLKTKKGTHVAVSGTADAVTK